MRLQRTARDTGHDGILRTRGARALILDVRGNAGGVVSTIEQVTSHLIREGPIYRSVDRQGREVIIRASGAHWGRDIPIAVLVDADTGSGAEMLAAALRENGVAHVLGARTAGTLVGSSHFPLADGSGLSVTVQSLRTGQGKELDGIGLEADEVVETNVAMLAAGQDNQLDAAVAHLRARLDQ